jgi:protein-S-isoprenylcysteine O-methyltransferase Ste14
VQQERTGIESSSHRARDTGILRPFLTSLAATIVFTAIVLVSAGRASVWQAWVYAGISLVLNLGQRLILSGNPELARERARPAPGAPSWEKAILALGLLLTVTMLVTAGLQFRYLGGPSLSWIWFFVGVALSLTGALLFLWALNENRFFGAVVRVQAERGQDVCMTGPYRVVRHPGNLGMIIGTLGLPLLFQSTWSLVPAGLSVAALLVRTHLEDAFLTKGLGGYGDYRKQTRFRLVPGLW